jgi:hypothetical protein
MGQRGLLVTHDISVFTGPALTTGVHAHAKRPPLLAAPFNAVSLAAILRFAASESSPFSE